MKRRLAAALLLACAACAGDHDRPSAAGTVASGPAYLVWSADSASSETAWIDGEGKVIARRPGVFVAGSGGVWEWRAGTGKSTGLDCECVRGAEFEQGASCQVERAVGTAELADLLNGRHVAVLEAESDPEEAPPGQDALPLSGVGPYLFIESRIEGSACGAHGWVGVEVEARDLSRGGAVVEMVDSVEAERVAARVGGEARGMLRRDYHGAWGAGPVEEGDTLTTNDLELNAVRVAWTPSGELDVRYQLTVGTCYACGDGIAGSYTRSVLLPADSVPAPLRPYSRAPDAVRAYWRSAPPARRAGWSQVDAADPAAALARFRGGR